MFPKIVNPLTVASNSSKKLRLVLDCRHINKFLHSFKFRLEDSSLARSMFHKGDVGFRFDLKSAYHHIEIFPEHRNYLGFYWNSKYYVFNVLPFGVSTAAYIFTKVLRHIVKYWRSQGIRIILYLDDGFAVAKNPELAANIAFQVKQDLLDFGFLISEEKSDWTPKSHVTWLGHNFNFVDAIITLTDDRLNKILKKVNNILCASTQSDWIAVRTLASIVGSIQSSEGAVGNVAKLMTKYCHMCIETRWSWNSLVYLNQQAREELTFWAKHLRDLNGQTFVSQTVCDVEVYSDASSVGYGGFILGIKYQNGSGSWTDSESEKSSTWRELEAVFRLLVKFADILRESNVRWNVDNKNVVSIITKGSMNADLQKIAIQIFNTINLYSISLFPVWIPRELNKHADYLSKYASDSDDWQISWNLFHYLTKQWFTCDVDRFACNYNSKCYRFNSREWCADTEAVNSFTVPWSSDTNWVVPPPKLGSLVVQKMIKEKAKGIVILPVWKSAPFWPLLFDGFKFRGFITDYFVFQKNDHIKPGRHNNGMFTDNSIIFDMIAMRFEFISS